MKSKDLLVSVDLLDAPVAVIRVGGSVVADTCPRLEAEMDKVLDGGHDHLVLDMSELDFMSTAGWSVLVAKLRRVRARKGALHLCGLSTDMEDVYKMLQFESVIPHHATLDQALAAVRSAASAGS